MPLPRLTPQYQDVEIDGLGTIRARPLTRGEFKDIRMVHLDDPQLAQLQTVVICVDAGGENVEQWLDSLPLNIVIRIMSAISALNHDDIEQAAGN